MKTHQKCAVIGLIVAFLGSSMTAHALMSSHHNAVAPYSEKISANMVMIKKHCIHLPYSKQKIKDFFDNKMGFLITYMMVENMPVSVNEEDLVGMTFFDEGEKDTQVCVYYYEAV